MTQLLVPLSKVLIPPLSVRSLLSDHRGEAGRPSAKGPVTESLLSRTSGPRSEGRPGLAPLHVAITNFEMHPAGVSLFPRFRQPATMV